MTDAAELIERLGLRAHPEGGWYGETWRAPAPDGGRPASSAILYLLRAGERSHWHRIDADEIWHAVAGGPLELRIAMSAGSVAVHHVGADLLAGESAHVVVPAGAWQSAAPLAEWSLVGCIVAPAFEFDGFELAHEGWEP